MFFRKSPEYKGRILMISPQDGRVEATVEMYRDKN